MPLRSFMYPKIWGHKYTFVHLLRNDIPSLAWSIAARQSRH